MNIKDNIASKSFNQLGANIKDIVFLRAGYHYGNEKKAVPSYASCGLGLEF